ncbi:MAG TPA: hypothetical protein VFV81_05240, partial [Verrucomicrobiae bacterium]|nr:hypothetical protein [Verrucomicrobiae bacterium]
MARLYPQRPGVGRTTGLFRGGYLWLAALLLVCPAQSRANVAGGFTPLVTTPVTTGVEVYNSHTDHFLDNGILHVDITGNGNVESMKYLKPGTSGTPALNGVETVSQSGVNFGNHTAI